MDGKKRATTDVVARVCDALLEPPTSWVPLRVSPSPIPLSIVSEYQPAHIPLERGGAATARSLRHWLSCPHPERERKGRWWGGSLEASLEEGLATRWWLIEERMNTRSTASRA
jgi:hypothetical protein